MRRIVHLSVLVLALSACAAAPSRIQADREQLQRQADAWDAAIVRKDAAAIAANMSESFTNVDAQGRVSDKAAFLSALTADKLTIDPYTVEEFRIEVRGDVALLTGRTDLRGRYDGREFRSHYRYTDVYAREDGQWRVIRVQVTELAEP